MTTEQTENQEGLEHTLGEVLSRAREEKRKSIEEAAEATRVNANFLRALEADDFEKLPAEVFIRGFIRIYAGYLGLDPDDTYRHYLEQEEIELSRPEVGKYQNDAIDEEIMDRTSIFIKRKKGKILPVIILLAVLAIFYFLGVSLKPNDNSPDLPKTTTDITAPLIENFSHQIPESEEESSTLPEPQAPPLDEKQKTETPQSKPAEEQPPVNSPSKAKLEKAVTAPVISESKPSSGAKSESKPVKVAAADQSALPITVNVATNSPQASTKVQPSQDDAGFNYILKADFSTATKVRVTIDGQKPLELTPEAGTVMIWRANQGIVLELDDKNGVSLTLNGNTLPLPDDEEPSITVDIPGNLP